jgi:hypothetical protein
VPLFSPAPPIAATPPELVEAAPLYAGESVARIHDLAPAGELARRLAGS